MNFEIPEHLKSMVETVRRFRLEALEPIWQQVDRENKIPESIVQKMREIGLFGMAHPKAYGGLDLGSFGEALVHEELSKSSACFRSRIAGTNGHERQPDRSAHIQGLYCTQRKCNRR